MALGVEDVTGRDDGGSPDVCSCMRVCGFVLSDAGAAAATAVEGGGAVVPAPVAPILMFCC